MSGLSSRVGLSIGALRRVFENPDLRRLQAAWAIGTASQWALLVALLVYAYGEGGGLAVGVLGLFRTVPTLVGVPLASTLGDRISRVHVLIGAYALSFGATVAGALALAEHAPLLFVFVLAAVTAVAAEVVRPIQNSLLPALARSPDDLVASNVATSAGEGIGVLVGPAVGALLLTLGPASGATGAALGMLFATIEATRIHPQAGPSARRRARRGGLLAAVETLAGLPAPTAMLLLFGVQPFVRGVLTVLVVIASIGLLGLGKPGVGLLNSMLGLGGIAGAIAAIALVGRPRLIPPFWASLVLWGAPIAVLGLVPVAGVAVVALAVIGAANAVLDVSGFTLIQRSVPNDVRSSVMGLFEGYVAAMAGLGGIVAPVLVALLGVQGALVATGLLLPVLATAALPTIRLVDAISIVPVRELALLRGSPMFATLPMGVIEDLAGALVPVTVPAGGVVMRQGEDGDRFFVIDTGTAEVSQDGRILREIGPGASVGEIALLRGVPRTATVTAISPLRLLSLDAASFVAAVTGDCAASEAATVLVDARLANAADRPGPA